MCPSAVSLLISFYVLPSLALFRVVSAVLQFGNMAFKQERSSEQAIMPSNEGEFFLPIHLIQVVYNSIQNLSTSYSMSQVLYSIYIHRWSKLGKLSVKLNMGTLPVSTSSANSELEQLYTQ